MKKFILPAIIVLIIIAVYIVIKTIDFGALTIVFLERTANIDIKYIYPDGICKNIGFKIKMVKRFESFHSSVNFW